MIHWPLCPSDHCQVIEPGHFKARHLVMMSWKHSLAY